MRVNKFGDLGRARVTLDKEDLIRLFRGETARAEGVEIILQDIGFFEMHAAASEAERINHEKETKAAAEYRLRNGEK